MEAEEETKINDFLTFLENSGVGEILNQIKSKEKPSYVVFGNFINEYIVPNAELIFGVLMKEMAKNSYKYKRKRLFNFQFLLEVF